MRPGTGPRPAVSPSSPDWMVDELAHAGRENLDPAHARRYDAKEDSNAAADVALLASLGLDGSSSVVDLGAGTGQFTVAVAPLCRSVVAVDVSEVMLAELRAKLVSAGIRNVEVATAGFLTYEHRGAAVDVVHSRWALHHLPDVWKALALVRIRRILREGGILRLSDIVYHFEPHEAEERLEAWCASLPADGTTEGEWHRRDIVEHVRDEHSTYSWVLEPMIERCGFRIEQVARSEHGPFAAYVARAV